MFTRILLAVDGTESGDVAVSFTSALARQFDAQVRVVHVNELLVGGRGFGRRTVVVHDERPAVGGAHALREGRRGWRGGGSAVVGGDGLRCCRWECGDSSSSSRSSSSSSSSTSRMSSSGGRGSSGGGCIVVRDDGGSHGANDDTQALYLGLREYKSKNIYRVSTRLLQLLYYFWNE